MHFLDSLPSRYRWIITALLVVLITVLSVTPDHSRPDDSIFAWLIFNASTIFQKLMHFAAYLVLAGSLYWSLDCANSRRFRILLGLGMTIALGIILEWFQTYIPGRYGSLFDILINTVGAVVGTVLAIVFL